MIEIKNVKRNSLAQAKGIEAGDKLLKINGFEPRDYIDYMNCISSGRFELEIAKNGEDISENYKFNRSYGDKIGLEFDSIIFDDLMTCDNNCQFCFIDQQPPGVRDSLSRKDDDYRFSFLQGSFITLTNIDQKEMDRIISNNLSPLYISVHTTNPDLRRKMMNNPRAAKINDQLKYLAQNNIKYHLQLVICPGINDGEELERTLADLQEYTDSLLSVGIVPVGLTAWRNNESDLSSFDRKSAQRILAIIDKWQEKYARNLSENRIYAADEFYILADIKLPEKSKYGNFPQLENGIGLARLSRYRYRKKRKSYPDKIPTQKHINIFTAELGKKALKPVWKDLRNIENLCLSVHTIENNYLGKEVTVTGLLSGQDILAEINSKNLDGKLIIPDIIFNDEGLTLDDFSLLDFQTAANSGEIITCGSMVEVLEVIFNDDQTGGGNSRQA